MTLDEMQSLDDAIDAGLEATYSGPTRHVARWIRFNREKVIEANWQTIADEGLCNLIRRRRKHKPTHADTIRVQTLCFQLGLPHLNLNTEISRPRDMKNVLFGRVDWVPIQQSTVRDLKKHYVLLQAQGGSIQEQANDILLVIQAAQRIAPGQEDMALEVIAGMAHGKSA